MLTPKLHLFDCVINAGGWIYEGKVIAVPAAVLGNQMRLNNSRMPASQHSWFRITSNNMAMEPDDGQLPLK